MKRHIVFVTTNSGKFEEVKKWVDKLDPSVELEQAAIDLPEYQSLDVHTVAIGKAYEAWRLIQRPLLIDDGGIYLEKYNQFPGTLSKYVFQGIGFDGFWLLAKDDPRAYFLSCLVYMDKVNDYHFFEGICKGTIVPLKGAVTHPQLPFTDVFVPENYTQTFGQLRDTEEELKFHHRFKAIKKFLSWLNEA